MSNQPYARWPSLHGEHIIFVAEDDLWSVSTEGGIARRLTTTLATVARPILSPNGKLVTFTGRDEGFAEIFVMPALGGPVKRLTFTGMAGVLPLAWQDDKTIIFASSHEHPFGLSEVYSVSVDGGPMMKHENFGHASGYAVADNGRVALGRLTTDSARWKRYRGGTAGVIWVQSKDSSDFEKLGPITSNISHPMWLGSKLYFVSDHEGIGNIYSCDPDNLEATLKRETSFTEYYVRWPQLHGNRIVFFAGGDLHILNTESGASQQLNVVLHSPRVQRQRKFVDASKYLEAFDLHPEGSRLALTCRGRAFSFPLWEGAVRSFASDKGRQRLPVWLDSGSCVFLDDRHGEEIFMVRDLEGAVTEFPEMVDFGRPVEMVAVPGTEAVVFTNHKYELCLANFEAKTCAVIDKSDYARISGPTLSRDGQWLAYSCPSSGTKAEIRLAQLDSEAMVFNVKTATNPVLADYGPSFSPCGRYLLFLSTRVFNPIYDDVYFSLGFPQGTVPCVITLKKETKSPFELVERAPGEPLPDGSKSKSEDKSADKPEADTDTETSDEKDEKKDKPEPVEVDLDGFADRCQAFPVDEGRYAQLYAASGNKVFYTRSAVKGAIGSDWGGAAPAADKTLYVYDFESQKESEVTGDVSMFKIAHKGQILILRRGHRLRVCKASPKLPKEGGANREAGWLDLKRVRAEISPVREWKQMMREAWRLQRDHFWDPEMTQIDWQIVFDRYFPLIDRISSRAEFSDLMWEMQGELGTSHAYEMGGDHRSGPRYPQGMLGADLRWDDQQQGWIIKKIHRGDAWDRSHLSPLAQPGLDVQEGDKILAVNEREVTADHSPQQLLVNQGNVKVTLKLSREGRDEPWQETVKTVLTETPLRYRDWVNENRARVHEATNGKIGYVHIPDMGPEGYAEFFRGFIAEAEREGLIVDARFNRGGHVSQLLLEKLSRKRLGYDAQRHGKAEPYPAYSFDGPIVALTNEHAGSDGDIFCHSFKMLELGPLIGKRTWGGVIGIHPRHYLADGTVTTQPEFSFWFKDVGFGVENYGTDPDIDLDWAPNQISDVQLERGISESLRILEDQPIPKPDLENRPNLALPKLNWEK